MPRSLAVVLLLAACHGAPAPVDIMPAVLVSGASTIPYPPDLFSRHIQGAVLLYLVVDSTGQVVRDSTRVATSSGQAAFDSAALAAAPRLQFTPAHRGKTAVTAPIQVPINFRLPDSLLRSGRAR
jgi:TonB family protein